MVIEFLLIKIREENIKGLRHNRYEYKVRAFAHDLVFILENPINSVSNTIQEIKEFGELAGFYLNQKKIKTFIEKCLKRSDGTN